MDAAERAMREPLPAHKRAEILVRVAGYLGRRHEEVAQTICAEAGKPLKAARVEVSRAMSTYTYAAVEARTLAGEMVPMDGSQAGAGKLAFTLRRPIGVVGAISPFNFPLNLVAHKIAPALAAGCAVVLKPAAQTPLSALLLAELETEAGLPPGWLNVVVGPAAEIGDVLVEDERVKLITFTGSSDVGWKLRERAPRKRVNLELGNATPVIVAADADLDDVAGRLATHAFSFAGQSCISVQRIYVERPALDGLLERFLPKVQALRVGDPADEETDVGPLIDRDARDRVLEWIEEARAAGAEVLAGGGLDGELVQPTVIANAGPDLQVSCREVFGPVCTVNPYDTLDEAIELANGTAYGLQAGIFTASSKDALAAARAARVRRRHDQRGADVPRRPDAVRRREGLGQHAGRATVGGARDDRGAPRRPHALAPAGGGPAEGAGTLGGGSMARLPLFTRLLRPQPDAAESTSTAPPPPKRRHAVPPAGALRRERRALLRVREQRLRDLGGLALEMYRRDRFREDLLLERCAELIGLEARVHELDAYLGRTRAPSRPRQSARCDVRRAAALRLALLRELRTTGRGFAAAPAADGGDE